MRTEIDHPHVPALRRTFQAYVDGINEGDYHSAYNQRTPASRRPGGLREFARGARTSYIFDVRIRSLTVLGPDTDRLTVTFTTIQDPKLGPDGQDCSHWHNRYEMRRINGQWLIDADAATPVNGTPTPC
ncbi:hypothetical protein BH20ACT9_BH20ACT9_02990 [soil metagenome]